VISAEAGAAGFPYAEAHFGPDGGPVGGTDVNATVAAAAVRQQATDVLLLAHGWRTDGTTARALYADLAESLRSVWPAVPMLAGRRLLLVGVFWPSVALAADGDDLALGSEPSGGLGPRKRRRARARGATVEEAATRLAAFADAVGDVGDGGEARERLDACRELLPRLEESARARHDLVDSVRDAVRLSVAGGADEPEEEPAALLAADSDELVQRLSADVALPPAGGPSGAPAAGGGRTGRCLRAVARLLDYGSYAVMRARSGVVGAGGVARLLVELRAAVPGARLHLAGHSFGGRLAAAAACGPPGGPAVPVHTLCLLQAAFSHYGFARQWDGQHDGVFRRLLDQRRLAGPALVTYTANDRAVGYPYALASLLLGHAGVVLGDARSRYGAIGRNGAQRTAEAAGLDLERVGVPYQWQPGRLHNLRADAVIQSHGDVTGPAVAYALLSAIASGGASL
jgi:hypothetical protein